MWLLGELVCYKMTADQSDLAYSQFEEIVRPREGIPPRIGHREDGCLYLVEGELGFLAGEKILRAESESLVYVPGAPCTPLSTSARPSPAS